MKITNETICIFDKNNPTSLQNYAADMEQAKVCLAHAVKSAKESAKSWEEILEGWEKDGAVSIANKNMAVGYIAQYKATDFAIGTWSEFEAAQKTHLIGTIHEITENEWMEMLEVLPPMGWKDYAGFNAFFMSERYTGSFTEMYARKNGKFYSAMVDLSDRETWIPARMNNGEEAI